MLDMRAFGYLQCKTAFNQKDFGIEFPRNSVFGYASVQCCNELIFGQHNINSDTMVYSHLNGRCLWTKESLSCGKLLCTVKRVQARFHPS